MCEEERRELKFVWWWLGHSLGAISYRRRFRRRVVLDSRVGRWKNERRERGEWGGVGALLCPVLAKVHPLAAAAAAADNSVHSQSVQFRTSSLIVQTSLSSTSFKTDITKVNQLLPIGGIEIVWTELKKRKK